MEQEDNLGKTINLRNLDNMATIDLTSSEKNIFKPESSKKKIIEDESFIKDSELLKHFIKCRERYIFKKDSIAGGMGQIFFVYDKLMNRNIILKELTKTNQKSKIRFVREARLTARLEHPSIIPVYEIGVKDDKIYYTMKEIKGKTLSQAIREAKTLENRLKLLHNFLNLCYALAYAHKNNIIHRDLKPANVMIGEFGETILLDWGLAKDLNEKTVESPKNDDEEFTDIKTIVGKVFGTPSYMSPEQAKGDTENIDKISDIYSLGTVLYTILTGHSPYKAKTTKKILKKVINSEIVPMDKDIPKELIAITKKAMKQNKLERYPSVSKLAEDINSYLSGKNVFVYKYTFWDLIKRFYNKNSANKVISFLGLTIMFIAFLSYIFIFNSLRKEKKARFAANTSLLNEKKATEASNYNFSISLLQKAQSLLKDKRINEAQIYAAAALKYNPKKNGNNITLANSILYEAELSMIFKEDFAHKFDFYIRKTLYTNKKDKLIIADDTGSLHIWNIKKRKLEKDYKIANSLPYDINLSKDDKKIIMVNTDFCLRVLDFEKRKELNKRCFDSANRIYSVRYYNNEKEILTIGRNRDILFLDSETLKEKYRIKGIYNNMITYLSDISKNRKYLVTADSDRHIIVWDLEKKKLLSSFMAKEKIEGIRIFKKDIFVSSPENILIFDIYGNSKNSIKKDSSNSNIKIYNDEYLIAIGNFLTIWDIKTKTKLSKIKIINVGYDKMVIFPKDKNKITIFSSSGEMKELIIIKNKKYMRDNKSILYVDLSNNNEMLATSYRNKDIIIEDYKTKKIIKSFKGGKIIKFSKNNKYLAATFNKMDIRLYDIKNDTISDITFKYKKVIHRIEFSEDNSKIIIGTANGYIIVYDIEKKISKIIKAVNLATLSIISNNNFTVVSGLDKNIVFFDKDFNKIDTISNKEVTEAIDIFDNNTKILVSGKDSNTYLWNIKTKTIIDKYNSNSDSWIHKLKISPNEKMFVTVGNDSNIRLWDIKTKNKILDIHIPALSEVTPLFTNNSKSLIVLGDRLYRFPLDDIISNIKDINYYEDRVGLKLDGFLLKIK